MTERNESTVEREQTQHSSEFEARIDELERIVERQQQQIERQRDRLADGAKRTGGDRDDGSEAMVSRRGVLKAGGLVGLLGLAGTASADPRGAVGTTSDPLENLHAETVNADTLDDHGSGAVTMNAPLDTDGNGIESATSVSVDIDADGDGTGESFSVTHDGGTSLLTVADSGDVDVHSGSLDLNGNDVANVASVTVDSVEDGSGNTHLTVNDGGNLGVGRTLDVTSGTVTNATGALTLSTDSGDLDLNPSGNVDANGNTITNAADVQTDAINGADTSSSAAADQLLTTDGSGNLTLANAVTGSSSNYEIQKNGSDGTGVINFKT